jgi:hypothetical protein
MCFGHELRRRREADESDTIWQDFERTRPLADTEPAPDSTPAEPTEAREEAAATTVTAASTFPG